MSSTPKFNISSTVQILRGICRFTAKSESSNKLSFNLSYIIGTCYVHISSPLILILSTNLQDNSDGKCIHLPNVSNTVMIVVQVEGSSSNMWNINFLWTTLKEVWLLPNSHNLYFYKGNEYKPFHSPILAPPIIKTKEYSVCSCTASANNSANASQKVTLTAVL